MASYNYRCGACKLLRRKCTDECIFAPHFSHDEGVDQFASIHKIFGAKNFSKFLSELHPNDHDAAVKSILYEAQARLLDPVYGCVSQIINLQQQVEALQAQVANLQAVAMTTMGVQDFDAQLQPNMPPSNNNNINPPEGSIRAEDQRNFHQYITIEDYMQWLLSN